MLQNKLNSISKSNFEQRQVLKENANLGLPCRLPCTTLHKLCLVAHAFGEGGGGVVRNVFNSKSP